MFLTKPPEPGEPEPDPVLSPAELTADETHAFGAFEDLGFSPFEAFTLVLKRVSPSEVREFCRRHQCDARTAVSILL